MMPPYRLANLTPDQMLAIDAMEHDLGVTLVAYELTADAARDSVTNNVITDADEHSMMDALHDAYRTYDPYI